MAARSCRHTGRLVPCVRRVEDGLAVGSQPRPIAEVLHGQLSLGNPSHDGRVRSPAYQRLASLRAALGFPSFSPARQNCGCFHRCLDTWTRVGLIVVGVERQGLRFSMSHIAEGEWRAYFIGNPIFAPDGFGVAPKPLQGR